MKNKKWLWNLVSVVLLAVGLGLWIALPWQGVLGVVVLVGLWLALTRSGRVALAATRIGIASLPQRWGASSVIIVGIAGVVGVLVAMLAMGEGFEATLKQTGNDTTAILLRGGSQAETNSVINRDQSPLIGSLPGVAKDAQGRAVMSAELSQVVNLPTASTGEDANAQFRGVSDAAWAIRPQIKLIEGRKFNVGVREIVVGQGAKGQYRGLEVGKTIKLGNQDWTVVGVFASGDAFDSELWTDIETLSSAYDRRAYQSVTVGLDGKDGFNQLKAALDNDPRLKLDVQTTRDYYSKQTEMLTNLIRILGMVIGSIMAVGAVFGALNTMYAAVAGRAREIATMRAIGFRGLPVVMAVMLETMLLALLGGVLGGLIAWAVFNGYSVATLGSNFSQVVFQFKVSPGLLWSGLKWALGIGLVGGLFPALRAARLPITAALRAL
ncbi:ABC transporter permease [Pseudoxanthomonas wuyuanensis]|uniref:Putative ABC transport system permease protein n=1 Tax=Pseudoxanthomonas wuyuanensis TaxID=1073196 RepID=A0A286D2B4_9GAMM|nr:ABC transporter permease [Pseudoxanthomonas wuyuanensis]KAF1723142.1 ABC transporter permease [Pseudoxanthomonas wuyuanensis]SOD52790.1 putative ABC transport system permease protein [Pseudoxanthomonas wuyuanensis]